MEITKVKESNSNEIYFIQGVKYRGEEVLKLLRTKCSDIKINYQHSTGEDSEELYFIEKGEVRSVNKQSLMAELLYKTGTELVLVDQILPYNWENVSKLMGDSKLSKIELIENNGLKHPAAYAKLLAVREYGKAYYGNFPALIGCQYYIEAYTENENMINYMPERCKMPLVSQDPLVFDDKKSCNEFIKNNKNLLNELLGVN